MHNHRLNIDENITKDSQNLNLKIKESYEKLNYPSSAYAASHPMRLNVIASLLGLSPEPIETAKILEIGCSFGGNIIPMAIHYPHSQILGIDLAENQIELGKKAIAQIGLDNIQLECHDVTTFKTSEKFDYIICHGVYSWVPDRVKDAIMKLIQSNLSENGLAYVSYNTYPGWKIKEIFKDAMQYHSNNHKTDDISLNVEFANSFIKFLAEEFDENSLMGKSARQYCDDILNSPKSYVAHEYLEAINDPCYFYQFMDNAHKNNLGYVSDAGLYSARFGLHNLGISEQAQKAIHHEAGDQQEKIEQYFDFLRGTAFRATILAHAQKTKKLEKHQIEILHKDIFNSHISGKFAAINEQFWQQNEQRYKANKLSNFIFEQLNAHFPGSVSVRALFEECKVKLASEEDLQNQFINIILSLFRFDAVGISPHAIYSMLADTEKLKIPAKLRKLNEFSLAYPNTINLANAWHQPIFFETDYIVNHVFNMLDGTNNLDSIYNKIMADYNAGYFELVNGENIKEADIPAHLKNCVTFAIESIKESF